MADSQRKTANLFDKATAPRSNTYPASQNTIEAFGQGCSTYIKCLPNTTYTITKIVSSRFAVCYTTSEPLNGVSYRGLMYNHEGTKITITTDSEAQYLYIFYYNSNYDTKTEQEIRDSIMVNAGSTVLPYEPYGWLHSLRKLTTATEAVENPLYSDGTAITAYTIKGNEEHTGTPSPQNPVMPNGVGVRTENYFNVQNYVANITTHSCTVSAAANGVKITATGSDAYAGEAYKSPDVANSGDSRAAMPVEENTSYVLSADVDTFTDCYISYLNSSYKALNANYTKIGADVPATFTTPTGTAYIALRLGSKSLGAGQSKTFANITLTKNGLYKIPISSGGVTTNIYLGSTQTYREINKLVLKGDETWNEESGSVYISSNYFHDLPVLGGSPLYCTHFPNDNTGMINGGAWWFRTFGYTAVASDVTTWKAYLAQQYAAGTPVTVWYVLATPQTAAVNEPLMKIGTYADTLSNAASIPTTEGANSITVDTTVQPSEFTATWTGWHDASVKEKSENLWDENMSDISSSMTYKPLYVGDNTVTMSSIIPQTSQGYANLFLKRGISDSGATTGDNGVWDGNPRTFEPINGWVTVAYRNANGVNPQDYNIMLNIGSTALPYEPYWK